ncbi:MAG: polyphenol oxidase family protein [Bacteroidota bacterium]
MEPQPALDLIRPAIFADLPGVTAGFSTRAGGVSDAPFDALNMGFATGDDEAAVQENRRRFLSVLGFGPDHLATIGQVHGVSVTARSEPGFAERNDGHVTDRRGLALGILVADCGAVLLADAKAGVVGACHAGWRGAVGGIPIMTVEAMRKLKAEPERIRAYVSPCIGPDDFEVGTEVARQFDDAHVLEDDAWTKPHVDLSGAIVAQLLKAGLDEANIQVEGCSTFDTARFFSYRADGGTTGRMMGVIGLT